MAQKRHDDQTARLLKVLKRLFKSRGLRYADIASALGLSHTTLKRRLAGIGLTIPFVEALADLVDATLPELFELANSDVDTRVRRLTLEQENALHADVRLGFIFSRLQLGWSAKEIQEECRIPEVRLIPYLVRLEKLGLIDLFPGDRIRRKTAREIEWRKHGPMWHSVDRYLKDIFTMTDSDDVDLSRRIAVVRLSAPSVAQIDRLFHDVQAEIRRLAQDDRRVPTEEKTWYALLLGARPFEIDLDTSDEIPWRRRHTSQGPTAG
jgi:transcriptional regulator with XRE-family HTH domain